MENNGKTIIRAGGPDDIPVILGMLDSAVTWLVAQGRTRQWGTESWSGDPRAVALVERYVTEGMPWIAEVDGAPVATLTLTDGPGPYLAPADEPERYIHLLARDRRAAGRGTGAALLAHAAEETRRAGISLLRVDCYAGGDGGLVAYYERNGFVRTESYRHGEDGWPGQVLARRVR
ncbi:GNAT family N-acetyltransferase [Streptomyces sp. IBSBF 3136]|uniref:GNAT family N-acetyltransferase n=1 Tax=Streptomyces sp. IBSBF 3136 TaxID=2903524 RepID=UPI002FDC1F22